MTKEEARELVHAYRRAGGTQQAIVLPGGNLGLDGWPDTNPEAIAFWHEKILPLNSADRTLILEAMREIPVEERMWK